MLEIFFIFFYFIIYKFHVLIYNRNGENMEEIISNSELETKEFAKKIASKLSKGDVIILLR